MGQNLRRRTEPRADSPLTKDKNLPDDSTSKSWCNRYRYVVPLILLSALLLGVLLMTPYKTHIIGAVSEIRHAVMMDAGSTGTRVFVFTFQASPDDPLVLMDEFFNEVEPGISSYAENPQQAAASIQVLIDDVKMIVPAELRATTTVSLKATAGLRLLPAEVAENLLNVIRDVFASSGFLVRSDAVTIIDGTSEGFFLWTTINFLLGKTTDMKETVAVVDCGGASAQLALVPLDPDTIRDHVPPEDLVSRSVFNRTVDFYIHSYLGMGLMAMRLAVLRATNRTGAEAQKQTNVFHCPFVTDGANFTWQFQGIEYNIRGLKKTGAAGPIREVKEIIEDIKVHRVKELEHRTLNAVSYFYDVAVAVELIDRLRGGTVTVGDYCRSARKACESLSTDEPFLCIDATYICLLFRDGFALPEDETINLQKKIKGHETSWSLGAALADLHAHPD